MSSYEIKGKLVVKEDEVQISGSFKKREFVIEVINERDEKWNDFIKFQLTQDKCALIEPLKIGDEINVSFNVRGRKWEKEGKVNFFNSLECWKLEVVNAASRNEATGTIDDLKPQEEGEDLPF